MPHPAPPHPSPFPTLAPTEQCSPSGQAAHAAENNPFLAILGFRGILQEAKAAQESRSHPVPQLFALQSAAADLGSLQ